MFWFDSRNTIAAVDSRKQREAEEKDRALAAEVDQATVNQLKHRFEVDMEVLRSRVQGQQEIAKEAALDTKYLAQRQVNLR